MCILVRHIKEVEVCLHSFLTSAVDGGEWSTSCLGHITPGKESLNPFIMRLGVDLRVGVGCFGEEKNVLFLPKYEHQTVQPIAKLQYQLHYPIRQ
jgi:hypothetical protein